MLTANEGDAIQSRMPSIAIAHAPQRNASPETSWEGTRNEGKSGVIRICKSITVLRCPEVEDLRSVLAQNEPPSEQANSLADASGTTQSRPDCKARQPEAESCGKAQSK